MLDAMSINNARPQGTAFFVCKKIELNEPISLSSDADDPSWDSNLPDRCFHTLRFKAKQTYATFITIF